MNATPNPAEKKVTASEGSLLAEAGLMTEQELADELGRCRRTIQRLFSRRVGPPRVRLGKRIFYRRVSVVEWLQRQELAQARGRGRGRGR